MRGCEETTDRALGSFKEDCLTGATVRGWRAGVELLPGLVTGRRSRRVLGEPAAHEGEDWDLAVYTLATAYRLPPTASWTPTLESPEPRAGHGPDYDAVSVAIAGHRLAIARSPHAPNMNSSASTGNLNRSCGNCDSAGTSVK